MADILRTSDIDPRFVPLSDSAATAAPEQSYLPSGDPTYEAVFSAGDSPVTATETDVSLTSPIETPTETGIDDTEKFIIIAKVVSGLVIGGYLLYKFIKR